MGRVVRKVPATWQHPKGANGKFIPLFDGADFVAKASNWDENNAKWKEGFRSSGNGQWIPLDGSERARTFADWDGDRPDPSDYMPQWTDTDRTHFMMYENTSEGTPLSPPCSSIEALAKWLADSGASWFAGKPTSYESWLAIIDDSTRSLPVFPIPAAVMQTGKL